MLYATTAFSSSSKTLLEASLSKFLQIAENGEGEVLYSFYYEQEASASSLDLAFNDQVLEEVESKWKTIAEGGEDEKSFMKFEERAGMDDDEDDDNDNGY